MKNLEQNWITEGLIDFEYKKYLLLAYLKEVNEHFDKNKLYPFLSEIITHYQNLLSLKEGKNELSDKFSSKVTSVDMKDFKLKYEKLIEDNEVMKEIESIINFSIPKFDKYLKEGKEIYDFIEKYINIYPVGITPINSDEGYLIVRNGDNKDTKVYGYKITIFHKSDEKYRGIYTNYMVSYTQGIVNTLESIKQELIKTNNYLPNPATYAIESEITFPFNESLFPIAKRCFVKYIADAA